MTGAPEKSDDFHRLSEARPKTRPSYGLPNLRWTLVLGLRASWRNGMNGIPGLEAQLEENTSQRTPCILVLDASSSMDGKRIQSLNEGLLAFEEALKADPVARNRVAVSIVCIGRDNLAQVMTPWTDAMHFQAPTIYANGSTPLGAGARLALSELESYKASLRNMGIPYTRPWVLIVSDGEPTDADWEDAAGEMRTAAVDKKAIVFPLAVEGASTEKLAAFNAPGKGVLRLHGLAFRELFVWLSASVSSASQAAAGTKMQIEAPRMITIET